MIKITQDIIDYFRAYEPIFTSTTDWPDAILTRALCDADCETGSSRWGGFELECHNFKMRGMFAYASHWLVYKYIQLSAQDPSLVSPSARLNIIGKTVGDESVNYRMTALENTVTDALSTTIYGVEYMKLRRRAGMGAVAV